MRSGRWGIDGALKWAFFGPGAGGRGCPNKKEAKGWTVVCSSSLAENQQVVLVRTTSPFERFGGPFSKETGGRLKSVWRTPDSRLPL